MNSLWILGGVVEALAVGTAVVLLWGGRFATHTSAPRNTRAPFFCSTPGLVVA